MSEEDWKNKEITFEEFLEKIPPYSPRMIHNLGIRYNIPNRFVFHLNKPEIKLYCSGSCEGERIFQCIKQRSVHVLKTEFDKLFLDYVCKNCEERLKTFVIRTRLSNEKVSSGVAIKIGEYPPFGPHTPPRLLEIIGTEKDIYLKGRRAESQGMGIGAFSYYRRIVENQWIRLIDKIVDVGKKTKVDSTTIDILEEAKKETQFSKAVDTIKDAIPPAIMIEEQNPLKLLHKALSEGIHNKSDEECLDLARSIRLVLTELSNKISETLREERELKEAVKKLVQKKSSSSSE